MIPTRIDITFDPSPRRARGQRREVFRIALRIMARSWQKTYLPRHFDRGARSRYGYRPRSRRYLERKARPSAREAQKQRLHGGFGEYVDLIYTGLTRHKAGAFGLIKAYPSRVTITLFTPSYVKIRPKGNRPNLYKELTVVTDRERAVFGRALGKRVDRGLNQIKASETVTVG